MDAAAFEAYRAIHPPPDPRRFEVALIYLMSSEVGSDAQIGFPSVETCIAIVCATSSELIGWHTFNTPDETTIANAQAFGQFILGEKRSAPVHLYGASSTAVRASWENLMVSIAGKLNYQGPVTIVDTHLEGGVYFEFWLSPGGAAIQYKKNAKVQYATMNVNVQNTPHRRIVRRGGAAFVEQLYGGDNGLAPVHIQPVVTSPSGQLRVPLQAMETTFNVQKDWTWTIVRV